MSQAAALPLDPGPASEANGGSVHGPACYDADGALTCDWPERHDESFTEPAPSPPDQPVATARSIGRLIDRLLTALVVAAAVAAVAAGILVFVANLHFQTVLSNSMRPTFSAGDVVVTQAVAVSSLRVGDVISFYPPDRTEPVIHRITSLKDSGAGVVITTRGDANPVDDLWLATLQGTTAYRLVGVVPFIGWLTDIRGPLLILAGLLVLLVLVRQVTRKGARKPDSPVV
ncbi:MAG: signal peptidase I [Candidatus Limnocylindrales bacterium]|jgi:signal peptidase